MSNGKSARPPQGTGTDGTRRMLDELDALMERMLALPVDAPADPPGPSVPSDFLPKLSATLTLLERGIEEAPARKAPAETPPATSPVAAPNIPSYVADLEEGIREAAGSKSSPGTSEPAEAHESAASPGIPASPVRRVPGATPPPPEAAAEDPDVPPALGCLPIPEITPLPRRRRAWTTLVLLPLLMVNWAWDFCTWLIGPSGRWLRSPTVKNLLGYTGLGLLAVAAGWLLKDWMGWTW